MQRQCYERKKLLLFKFSKEMYSIFWYVSINKSIYLKPVLTKEMSTNLRLELKILSELVAFAPQCEQNINRYRQNNNIFKKKTKAFLKHYYC